MPHLFRLVRDRLSHNVPVKTFPTDVAGDYYYLPLQCSPPEASIDILASYHRNQREFVKNVSRALPYGGAKLVVKEHPLNVRGGESFNDIPSVVTVSPDIDGRELILNSKCVVTISGTAAYEAGLFGVPAVVFSDLFFNELPTVRRCRSFEDLSDDIKSVAECKPDKKSVIAFLARLYSMSYEGYCESPKVYPDALKVENIRMVTLAFKDVIESYSSSKSATAASICSRFI